MTGYTPAQLQRQREIAVAALAVDQLHLANLASIHADVRENHRRTITMRIEHYTRRIAALDEALAATKP